MTSQEMSRREVEIDFVDSQPIDSTADVFSDPVTKRKLPTLISRLMEGGDSEALRREYGSELVEEAISILESRI